MDIDTIISNVIISLLFGYFIYNMKKIEAKAERAIDEAKTRQIIEDKLAPLKVVEAANKEDIQRIENKLDTILSLLIKK